MDSCGSCVLISAKQVEMEHVDYKKHGRPGGGCLNSRSVRWNLMEAHGAAGRDFLRVWRGNLVLPDIGWGDTSCRISHGRQSKE